MHALVLGFVTAFTLTYLIIPLIIRVGQERRLYDHPNERSAHLTPTPSLGGVGIFAGTICAVVLWTPINTFGVLQYILASFVLIFLVGVMDDLLPMSATKKFLGQVLVAIILAYKSDVRLTSLYGILGVHALPELTGFLISVVIIIGIINAFNLVDGINGLAGSVGLLACITWGVWFGATGSSALAVVAFSLAGAIVAFLKYNFTPAQIFMGDTGSLLIGTVCAILSIKFIEMSRQDVVEPQFVFQAAPAIAIAVLIIPLYDTLRVFLMRVMRGKSPFSPDKNHIHHLLLQAGLDHMQATIVLVVVNISFILLAFSLHWLGSMFLILIELSLALILTGLLLYLVRRRQAFLT
ncbi:MAG: MraY family glycosyltransferase [Saprospiraceae bacterium]